MVLAAKDQQTPVIIETICAANRLVPIRMTLHKEKEVISTVADEKGLVYSVIISVTRQGAAPSIPRAEEVDAMVRGA